MSILQDVINRGPNVLNNDYSFVDADTVRDNNNNTYRLQGVDSPEIAKAFAPDKASAGTAGAAAATPAIQNLARQQGFTNVVKLTNPDGSPMMDSTGTRQMIELHNDRGENFTTRLLETGVLKSGKYTSQDDLYAMEVAKIFGDRDESGEWGQAADEIAQGIYDDGQRNLVFRQQAINEQQRAAAPGLFTEATAFRDYDRDNLNNANNPFSEAWDVGWLGVQESAYGFAELVGDSTGIEGLQDIGEEGIHRARSRISEAPKFITETDDINGVGDAFEWLGSNIAMSLPYMAITSVAAVAAPITGGLSLSAPVAVYSGQTWNEMEGEKNAGVAVAAGVVQAALDRLGLAGIVKTGGAPQEVLKKATDTLVSRGMTKEAASKAVANASRLEMAKLAGEAAKVAKQQVAGKKIVKDLIKRGIVSGSSEGLTEALQETTAYIAATAGSDKEFSWNELAERAQKAAIAGGVIGGAFSIPATAYDAGAWADVAVRQAPADAKRLSQAGQWAEEEMKREGRIMTTDEIAAEARAAPDALLTLDDRDQAHKNSLKARDWKDTVVDTMTSAPALWRGATRWIFQPSILQQSRTARKMADMFGGQLQRTFSGSNFENWKHHQVSIYRNSIDTGETIWANLIGGDRKLFNRKAKQEASQRVYNVLRAAQDPETGRVDFSRIPQDTPNRGYIIRLGRQMQELGTKMWQDQHQYNKKLGYIDDYLMKYKAFDKRAIEKNQNEFVALLMSEYKMTEKDAKDIAWAITSNENVNSLDDAFSVTQSSLEPGSHKKRSLGLSENEKFAKFLEHDLISNIAAASKSAARYTAYQKFVGDQGKHLAKMLDDIEAEGVPKEQVDKMAAQLKNYLDAESGNYKRATTEAGRKAQSLQRHFMTWTMFAGLPLATISSFVELALTQKGLTQDQIFNKKTGLSAIGREGASAMADIMLGWKDTAKGEYVDRSGNRSAGQKALEDLGFYSWDVGAATTTGVSESRPSMQAFTDMYFKAIGLQQWTDYTRAVRAAMAGDYIGDHLTTIVDNLGQEKTNAVQEAEEALRNLGINVPKLVEGYQKQGMAFMQSEAFADDLREASFNFINEAVALPQSGNRPLIYQDPRFALFTQFQGFVSTFTANHIPKLWGEYVKRGSPRMKYNAFATMATMIMLGFVSQHLKDLLKFGEESPYLDDAEYLQRGIRASGLLGTGERVLDQFFPLYEQRSNNPGEWLWNTSTGEAPATTNIKRVGKAGAKLLEGDVGEATRNLAKATPVIGPFSDFNTWLGEKASAWNFKE